MPQIKTWENHIALGKRCNMCIVVFFHMCVVVGPLLFEMGTAKVIVHAHTKRYCENEQWFLRIFDDLHAVLEKYSTMPSYMLIY